MASNKRLSLSSRRSLRPFLPEATAVDIGASSHTGTRVFSPRLLTIQHSLTILQLSSSLGDTLNLSEIVLVDDLLTPITFFK